MGSSLFPEGLRFSECDPYSVDDDGAYAHVLYASGDEILAVHGPDVATAEARAELDRLGAYLRVIRGRGCEAAGLDKCWERQLDDLDDWCAPCMAKIALLGGLHLNLGAEAVEAMHAGEAELARGESVTLDELAAEARAEAVAAVARAEKAERSCDGSCSIPTGKGDYVLCPGCISCLRRRAERAERELAAIPPSMDRYAYANVAAHRDRLRAENERLREAARSVSVSLALGAAASSGVAAEALNDLAMRLDAALGTREESKEEGRSDA